MYLARKKTPLELFDVAKVGGQAETVQSVMGEVIGKELDLLLSQLSATTPSVGKYAFIAGQVHVLQKILRSLNMSMEEAREAAKKLRGGE